MERYIDADRLHSRVKAKTNPYGKPTLDYESGVAVLTMIEQEPTADVVEVKHGGRWLRIKGDTPKAHKRKCSECGGIVYYPRKEWLYKGCPYCFVIMDGRSDT